MKNTQHHLMPFGATVIPGAGIRFALWVPTASLVALAIDGAIDEQPDPIPMTPTPDGWFTIVTTMATVGSRYRFFVDGFALPDPASRFQPEGVHGPSEVIDPDAFAWTDGDWRGRPWEESVLYELHVGTFTAKGTFAACEKRLDALVDLGITAIELMPLAASPGQHNWGYDGVTQFAPYCRYGRPEDLKSLVQAAHQRGLMVFVDVVYNHFGPEGNYLYCSAPKFFTDRHHTPWGAAINFVCGKPDGLSSFQPGTGKSVARSHGRHRHPRHQTRRGHAGAHQRAVRNPTGVVTADTPLGHPEPLP